MQCLLLILFSLHWIGHNIIGILPGKFRGIKGFDSIILVGAHYDTTHEEKNLETVDNASGMVAVLELARIISKANGPLNHTVIFVAFDHGDYGDTLDGYGGGSRYFLHHYFLDVLFGDQIKFKGTIIFDNALLHNTSEK